MSVIKLTKPKVDFSVQVQPKLSFKWTEISNVAWQCLLIDVFLSADYYADKNVTLSKIRGIGQKLQKKKHHLPNFSFFINCIRFRFVKLSDADLVVDSCHYENIICICDSNCQNSADSVPTSNLVCIKVSIRTTYSREHDQYCWNDLLHSQLSYRHSVYPIRKCI